MNKFYPTKTCESWSWGQVGRPDGLPGLAGALVSGTCLVPVPQPLFPQLRAVEGVEGAGKGVSGGEAAACPGQMPGVSAGLRGWLRRLSHLGETRPHTWPLTSPGQGTPGGPDKQTESQAEFSHCGCGHVARCGPHDTPVTPPRGCLAAGREGCTGVSEGAGVLSQGSGQLRPETTQPQMPQGAGRRVWRRELVGRPLAERRKPVWVGPGGCGLRAVAG